MTTDFQDIQAHAHRLRADYTARDDMYEQIRAMFHMEWKERPTGDWIKETMSPASFNQLMGAIRLLVSTDPQWAVPYDETEADAKNCADKTEQAARAMWNGSGRVTRRPIHYEGVMSGLLFAEIDASVTRTADMLEDAEKTQNKAHINRMKALAAETPYFYRSYNPMHCFPDFDMFGLRGHLYRVETTWGQVLDAYGHVADVANHFTEGSPDRLAKVYLNDWYDWEQRCTWVDTIDKPLIHADHELDFMPVECAITDGSFMFDRPDLQRMPFLYSVWKSQLWRRENLSLTVMYSLIHAMGNSPLYVRKVNQKGNALNVNRQGPLSYIEVEEGEEFRQLQERLFDAGHSEAIGLAQRMNEESTISKQALGAPPATQLAFSAISLLTQSGRLPLMATKNVAGMVFANLAANALRWWKAEGHKGKDRFYNYGKGAYVDMHPKDLPERIVMRCIMEPDLPTDKMQMANVAESLVKSQLASRRWVRENILQIGQSGDMEKEIWTEQRLMLEIETRMEQMRQMSSEEFRQAMQQMAQEMAAKMGGQVQASTDAGGGSGQQPVTPYPPGGQVTEGQPLTGPLPPRSAPSNGNGGGMSG